MTTLLPYATFILYSIESIRDIVNTLIVIYDIKNIPAAVFYLRSFPISEAFFFVGRL